MDFFGLRTPTEHTRRRLPESRGPPATGSEHDTPTTDGKGFPGGSVGKESAYSVGEVSSIPGLGRSPREGNRDPLQHSCLENPRDGGAWWAAVYGVAQSRTRLKQRSSSSNSSSFKSASKIHLLKGIPSSHTCS